MDREQERREKEEQRAADQRNQEAMTEESIKDMAKVAQELIKDPRYEAFKVFFESIMKGYMEMNSDSGLQEAEQKAGIWVVKQSMRTGAIDFIRDYLLGSPDALIGRYNEIEGAQKARTQAGKKYYYKGQGGQEK